MGTGQRDGGLVEGKVILRLPEGSEKDPARNTLRPAGPGLFERSLVRPMSCQYDRLRHVQHESATVV